MPPKPKNRKTPKPAILPTPENPTPSEFSTAIARTAVAQICHSIGFKVTQLSALEALTLVAVNYLVAIAKSSASYAAKANRTDSNLFDFTNTIHDLSFIQGFTGASELHRSCVLVSSVLKDLARFVEHTEETPFAWPIPRREEIGARGNFVPRSGIELGTCSEMAAGFSGSWGSESGEEEEWGGAVGECGG
ncbi:hypothetical protein ACLB2K_032613 [Fragaria x ananassa]